MSKILEDFHEGLIGGHFGMNITIKKILSSRYWWPTMRKLKMLNYVKTMTFANVLSLYGEVVKRHSNWLWHLNLS